MKKNMHKWITSTERAYHGLYKGHNGHNTPVISVVVCFYKWQQVHNGLLSVLAALLCIVFGWKQVYNAHYEYVVFSE